MKRMKKKSAILLLVFILVTTVLFIYKGTQRRVITPLLFEISLEERQLLNNFLEEKIFKDFLGYVLLGEKPVAWLDFPFDEKKS